MLTRKPLMFALFAVAACPPTATTLRAQDPVKIVVPAREPASPRAPTAAPAMATDENAVNVLREAVLSSSRAFEFVQSLTDDVGPRLSGSAGSKAAVAWAAKTLAGGGRLKGHAPPVEGAPLWASQ